ncbi:MAG TPA: hypothetical protein VFE55_21715 [Acidimicrobiia bacterium]|nr:hypothetical protein [Acidimicrobiia bacterium]
MGGQVVDTQSAEEFMRETLENVSRDELVSVAALLDAKSAGFAGLLGSPGQARRLDRADLRRVLRSVFATRRKADAILDSVGPDRLGAAIDDLIHGDGIVTDRFTAFDAVLADHPDPGFDLPSEILHFTCPDRWWLWTRWMWDPRAGTGSLPLVTTEDFDLDGPDRGETYLRVGEAMAFVNETGKAVGFTDLGSGLFGADVFLACVYAVYMYTVLRLRMTQEFNRIVPELPDLVRRLLGVYRPEV